MIKRLTMWHSREGVPKEEALRHWRTEHAVLVREVPGLRRYVQDHCIAGPDGAAPPYDGLGEAWFDSFEAATVAIGSTEWAAVLADAETFMDLGRITAAWAEEHQVI